MNAYIFHGVDGYPEENWFQWLKQELDNVGIETDVPQLPNPSHPDMNEWLSFASSFKTGPDTIFIGHSLGALLILRMLERGHKAKAVYLVAPFLNDLKWKVINESHFFDDNFDWKLIKKQCPKFEVFASKNDPYVRIEYVEEVANNLEVENQILDVERHFNTKEFPYLLERIEEIPSLAYKL
jgi:hypothetical protein